MTWKDFDWYEAELELARDLLDSDFDFVQRGDLCATATEDLVWMLSCRDGIATGSDGEWARLEGETIWRRARSDVEAAIEHRL